MLRAKSEDEDKDKDDDDQDSTMEEDFVRGSQRKGQLG
jgi:hypothetical protein